MSARRAAGSETMQAQTSTTKALRQHERLSVQGRPENQIRKQQCRMAKGGAVVRFKWGGCSGAPKSTGTIFGSKKLTGTAPMSNGTGGSYLSAI